MHILTQDKNLVQRISKMVFANKYEAFLKVNLQICVTSCSIRMSPALVTCDVFRALYLLSAMHVLWLIPLNLELTSIGVLEVLILV